MRYLLGGESCGEKVLAPGPARPANLYRDVPNASWPDDVLLQHPGVMCHSVRDRCYVLALELHLCNWAARPWRPRDANPWS